MKAFEFQTHVNADGTLLIPAELRGQVQPDQAVRVLLLLPEPNEDADWARLTAEHLLQGYDASDAIYDDLPTR